MHGIPDLAGGRGLEDGGVIDRCGWLADLGAAVKVWLMSFRSRQWTLGR